MFKTEEQSGAQDVGMRDNSIDDEGGVVERDTGVDVPVSVVRLILFVVDSP